MSETHTTDTPEQDRLRARLADTPERKIHNVHVSWGPGAASATDEERAAAINSMLDQGEAQDQERVSVRLADLRIVYEGMKRAIRLGQSTVDDLLKASPEVRDLQHKIFAALDMPLLHAGQMLPREERRSAAKKLEQEAANEPR
jgi:hypothetical protein